MKAPFSEYLNSLVPGLRQLLDILNEKYEYASILSTDSRGLAVRISQHSKSVSNQTMTTERGTVVRVMKDGLYSEYAMDRFDPEKPAAAAEKISEEIDRQLSLLAKCGTDIYTTGAIPDEPLELFVEKEAEILPEEASLPEIVSMLTELSDKAMSMSDEMLDCSTSAQSTHICKLFMTKNRFLRQSYVYSEGNVAAIVARRETAETDSDTELYPGWEVLRYSKVSGRKCRRLFLLRLRCLTQTVSYRVSMIS